MDLIGSPVNSADCLNGSPVSISNTVHVPGGRLVLALGGVDATISLLVRPPAGAFSAACQLRGHQDWVRSLAFAHVAPEDGQSAGAHARALNPEALHVA